MSKQINYRKEFEEVILKGKVEESMKSLDPNSDEKIYLEFCEEFKKCSLEKTITPQLVSISKKSLNRDFKNALETRRELLEYDLPSTTKEKKGQIITSLQRKYSYQTHYDVPFFVREKKKEGGKNVEENKVPILLTDEMISSAIQKNFEQNSKNKIFKISQAPTSNRHKIFLEMLRNKEYDTIMKNLINDRSRPFIPYYLMSVKEFEEVICFLNDAKEKVRFPFNDLTVEQLELFLKQTKNELYISKKEIMNCLLEKKYIKNIKYFLKKNDYEQVKKIINELYEKIKKDFPDFASSLLLYILKINQMLNIFDKNPFLEYMKNPCKDLIDNNIFIQKTKNDIYFRDFTLLIESFNPRELSSKDFIEKLLIEFLVNEKATLKDFDTYFKQEYLEQINYIANIYKGVNNKFDEKYISRFEYDNIIKKVEITICEHNKKEFKIEEDVKIDFDFKNIKDINISIYEINTENYYLEKKSPISSTINIEGIIASNTMEIKIDENEEYIPSKKIRKTILFDKIPKDQPGIYLIEILGNGISSRIIVKKGKLNLITRNTFSGLLCQIINEKNEIVKDKNTYLWYNNIKFTCEKDEGLIVIPYNALKSLDNKCILCHDNFAEITEIKPKNENCNLKGYFHFLPESINPGNMLKVNFKPLLFANGRPASLDLLQKCNIKVDMMKKENLEFIPISTSFEGFSFSDNNKEYEFEILIPPMMTEMKFSFFCEIQNITYNKNIPLSYFQNSNFETSSKLIEKNLFHKVGKNYYYEKLGRNGEHITTKAGKNASIHLQTNSHLSIVDILLQYDQEGKLNLGELKNVEKVNLDNIWYSLDEYSLYTYPTKIDLIEGESITLPVYSNKKINLDDHFFELYEYSKNLNSPNEIKDIKKEIILNSLNINGDNEHYYEFKLGKTLLKGNYLLKFGYNINENEKNQIIIKVREGSHWMNMRKYIINDLKFIENAQTIDPLYMRSLNINKENGVINFECSKNLRDIKNIHANIYLFQYQYPEPNSYFNLYMNMLEADVEKNVKLTFPQWKNIYLSNRVLNEEIQYVLQRRNFEDQLGNSLQMPSLLLKRAFKKDCRNEEEKLEQGNEYANVKASMGGRDGKSYGKSQKHVSSIGLVTDFYSFEQYSGFEINNIEPININSNENIAKFEIKLNDKDLLNKYSYMQIILIETKSINCNLFCLCDNNEKFEVAKRNISNEKALDSNKNLSEVKKTELIYEGQKFTINETSNFKLVDSIQKLSKFYLLTLVNKDLYWDKFKFILELEENKFDENKFLENYNEICGHEINLYLYFKYPKLFDKYIKEYLKYKFEKTFIDYFLLDDYETLKEYLTPLKIKKLNTAELCLLMLKIVDKNKTEAEKIRDIIKSRVKKPKDLENILLSNFNFMMNMKVEEDKQLKDIITETKCLNMEEEEDDEEIVEDRIESSGFRGRGRGGGRGRGRGGRGGRGGRMANNRRPEPKMEMRGCCKMSVRRGARRPAPRMLYCEKEMESEDKEEAFNEIENDIVQEKSEAFSRAVELGKKEMGAEFEKPGNVKEFKERHYFIKEHKNDNIENPLWLDLAEHILINKSNKNFLSKYVLYNKISFNEYLLILSVLDIPVESVKHNYKKIPKSRLVSITPSSNLILFTKELIETEEKINNKLLISQNLIDNIHNNLNTDLNNCTTNILYTHQTIVTNINNQSIEFELFIQIPQGAIGLNDTFYTNSIKMKLNPYQTKSHSSEFYFPSIGEFPQYHPLACKNSKIISKGNSLVYIVKKEYIPAKNSEILENYKYAKDMHIDGKLRNILSDDSIDSTQKNNKILKYFEEDIVNNEDIENILYILQSNKDFYTNLINILRDRGIYDHDVWQFGFGYKDEQAIREYLSKSQNLKEDVGYSFNSALYSTSEVDDAKLRSHLEYSPLFNARSHPFGDKNNNESSTIANKEFKETYQKFIINLLSVPKLSIKEILQLSYYLILQDRMEEAFLIFNKIKKDDLDNYDNNNKSFRIQYDYINAYLDFCFGYPEFKIAKTLVNKYKDFPLAHWREKFDEIEDELFEYKGIEKVSMNYLDNTSDPINAKKALTKELREKEPKMSFFLNQEGKITIIHSNISTIEIKLYFIDLETMFTINPKISEILNKDKEENQENSNDDKGNLGFTQPNYSEIIKIPQEKINSYDNVTVYEIPKEYKNKNVFFFEIKSESLKLFGFCLSSNLNVIITESLGELKVIDNNLKQVPKAYVKVYVELNDSSEIQFYKDGYTDLNGKFNYLALNTDQLKKAKKFYIYTSKEELGALIKECLPPKNMQNSSDNLLGNIQAFRQMKRRQWRLQNKI